MYTSHPIIRHTPTFAWSIWYKVTLRREKSHIHVFDTPLLLVFNFGTKKSELYTGGYGTPPHCVHCTDSFLFTSLSPAEKTQGMTDPPQVQRCACAERQCSVNPLSVPTNQLHSHNTQSTSPNKALPKCEMFRWCWVRLALLCSDVIRRETATHCDTS